MRVALEWPNGNWPLIDVCVENGPECRPKLAVYEAIRLANRNRSAVTIDGDCRKFSRRSHAKRGRSSSVAPAPPTVDRFPTIIAFGILPVTSQSVQPILVLLSDRPGGNPTEFMIEEAFKHHDIDWVYHTVEVKPDGLADAIRGMRAMGFEGGHVSYPHKEVVLPLVDRCSETATLVGSLNVLYREGDLLLGDNFEARGLIECLRKTIDPAGRRVAILGTGRAARAAAVELARLRPAQMALYGRNGQRAADLASMLCETFQVDAVGLPWEGDLDLPPETDILIHATALGREDPNAVVPLRVDSLSRQTVVADMTADPPDTPLLREAAERGCLTVDGLGMYVEQVAAAIALWTGIDPDRAVMREAIDEFLEV